MLDPDFPMLDRFAKNWVYGGTLAGILLLALAPLLLRGFSTPAVAAFLCLPIYMLHQFEEHDRDRFRQFVNAKIGGGADVLSSRVVFVINIPLVWGTVSVSFALAAQVHPGFCLIAVYLLLLNAVVHIVPAMVTRSYNPGLVTAIILFLPASAYGFYAVQQAGAGTLPMHALGAAISVATHAGLVGYVLHVKKRLLRAARVST